MFQHFFLLVIDHLIRFNYLFSHIIIIIVIIIIVIVIMVLLLDTLKTKPSGQLQHI